MQEKELLRAISIHYSLYNSVSPEKRTQIVKEISSFADISTVIKVLQSSSANRISPEYFDFFLTIMSAYPNSPIPNSSFPLFISLISQNPKIISEEKYSTFLSKFFYNIEITDPSQIFSSLSQLPLQIRLRPLLYFSISNPSYFPSFISLLLSSLQSFLLSTVSSVWYDAASSFLQNPSRPQTDQLQVFSAVDLALSSTISPIDSRLRLFYSLFSYFEPKSSSQLARAHIDLVSSAVSSSSSSRAINLALLISQKILELHDDLSELVAKPIFDAVTPLFCPAIQASLTLFCESMDRELLSSLISKLSGRRDTLSSFFFLVSKYPSPSCIASLFADFPPEYEELRYSATVILIIKKLIPAEYLSFLISFLKVPDMKLLSSIYENSPEKFCKATITYLRKSYEPQKLEFLVRLLDKDLPIVDSADSADALISVSSYYFARPDLNLCSFIKYLAKCYSKETKISPDSEWPGFLRLFFYDQSFQPKLLNLCLERIKRGESTLLPIAISMTDDETILRMALENSQEDIRLNSLIASASGSPQVYLNGLKFLVAKTRGFQLLISSESADNKKGILISFIRAINCVKRTKSLNDFLLDLIPDPKNMEISLDVIQKGFASQSDLSVLIEKLITVKLSDLATPHLRASYISCLNSLISSTTALPDYLIQACVNRWTEIIDTDKKMNEKFEDLILDARFGQYAIKSLTDCFKNKLKEPPTIPILASILRLVRKQKRRLVEFYPFMIPLILSDNEKIARKSLRILKSSENIGETFPKDIDRLVADRDLKPLSQFISSFIRKLSDDEALAILIALIASFKGESQRSMLSSFYVLSILLPIHYRKIQPTTVIEEFIDCLSLFNSDTINVAIPMLNSAVGSFSAQDVSALIPHILKLKNPDIPESTETILFNRADYSKAILKTALSGLEGQTDKDMLMRLTYQISETIPPLCDDKVSYLYAILVLIADSELIQATGENMYKSLQSALAKTLGLRKKECIINTKDIWDSFSKSILIVPIDTLFSLLEKVCQLRGSRLCSKMLCFLACFAPSLPLIDRGLFSKALKVCNDFLSEFQCPRADAEYISREMLERVDIKKFLDVGTATNSIYALCIASFSAMKFRKVKNCLPQYFEIALSVSDGFFAQKVKDLAEYIKDVSQNNPDVYNISNFLNVLMRIRAFTPELSDFLSESHSILDYYASSLFSPNPTQQAEANFFFSHLACAKEASKDFSEAFNVIFSSLSASHEIAVYQEMASSALSSYSSVNKNNLSLIVSIMNPLKSSGRPPIPAFIDEVSKTIQLCPTQSAEVYLSVLSSFVFQK